jgi:alpha-1,2-mannosyltransferase
VSQAASQAPSAARAPGTRLVKAGVIAFAAVVASWLVFEAVNGALSLVDLTVYRDGGLIVRHVQPYYDPHAYAPLYNWGGFSPLALKFTYTPFAAIAFALISFLPWGVIVDGSVVVNMAALVAALWVTFRALGYTDRRVRLGVTLLAAAATFWLQPVVRTIYLGQINLILMAAIMWDLLQPDQTASGRRRWWKGALTGVAAGIKLVPLIFVPYLLITRRFREAAAAVAGFVVTIAVGFAVLPHDSSKWWLHGMFMADGNRTGFMGWAGNQSLRAIATRFAGSVAAGQAPWIAAAVVAVAVGLTAAYLLNRAGYPRARAARNGADRTARLPGELGPPLGLDRPRGRRDRPLRRRRRPPPEVSAPLDDNRPLDVNKQGAVDRALAVGARRRDDLLLRRVAGCDMGKRADPR